MKEARLLAKSNIPQDELISFLLQIGVEREKSPHRIWDYALRHGEAIVWLELEDLENYPDPEVDALIESKLGASPQTTIVLHLNSSDRSEQLALGLAIQLAERWPCVLDNLSGLARCIFTLEDLRTLQSEKRGLWEDEKDIPLPEEWVTADEEYIAPWQVEEMKKQAEEAEQQAGGFERGENDRGRGTN